MEITHLVQSAKDGDKEALIQLIMFEKNNYYRLAYSYTGNEEDAMDAMEDMIVILHEKIRKLKDNASFYSWSKTILVNCCRDILRKRKRLVLVGTVTEGTDKDLTSSRDVSIDINRKLASLNPKQQEAIRLKYFMDYDYKTIAEITNTPEGTVKSRVSIGLNKLKQLLGGEYL